MARPVSDEQWHALLEDAGLVLRAWTRPGSWSWCDQYEQLVPVSRILWWAPRPNTQNVFAGPGPGFDPAALLGAGATVDPFDNAVAEYGSRKGKR
jgi:hypothetical protein